MALCENVWSVTVCKRPAWRFFRFRMTWWWTNNDNFFIFIPFTMPLFETWSSDDCWQVFSVFIPHSHPTGIFWMICQRPAETHSLLSGIQLNVLVLSQRSLAVFLSDCRREHLKSRASLPNNAIQPFHTRLPELLCYRRAIVLDTKGSWVKNMASQV